LALKDNPGVRYLALRDILALPCDDQEVIESREKAHQAGPIYPCGSVMRSLVPNKSCQRKSGRVTFPNYVVPNT